MQEINFVHKNLDLWPPECIDSLIKEGINKHANLFREGRDIWIIQTYVALKIAGYPSVSLSGNFRPDCINIAHRIDVEAEDCEKNFVVSVRADREPMFFAHYEIVQNRYSVWAKNHCYIPHWTQPGLVGRDASRGVNIRNLSFFGKACHIRPDFLQPSFRQELMKLSCDIKIHENDWRDYSETDLVIAIRDGHRFYLDFKPASKLVNAWAAGCPILLNHEAGYAELKRSKLDFFEATNPAEVLEIIKYLQENPEVYSSVVTNGRERAVEFNHEAVLKEWVSTIDTRIKPSFTSWYRRKPPRAPIRKAISSMREVIWGWQATQYPISRKRLLISFVRVSLVYPKFIIRNIKSSLRAA